jgi:hypothetical protein
MIACRPDGIDVLVRANHNQKLAEGGWLYEACDTLAELGRAEIEVQSASARTATGALRACRISIKRPKRNRAR